MLVRRRTGATTWTLYWLSVVRVLQELDDRSAVVVGRDYGLDDLLDFAGSRLARLAVSDVLIDLGLRLCVDAVDW